MAKFRSLLILLILVTAGCDSRPDLLAEPPVTPSKTDTKNAKVLAQCLAGAIWPPEQLSDEVAVELARIQNKYGGAHPLILGIEVRAPWGAPLFVTFDTETHARVRVGDYDDWDTLNEQYAPVSITINDQSPVASLSFDHAVNLCALGLLYGQLPGVVEVERGPLVGEQPDIFVAQNGDGRAYLFFYGEGGCPDGCLYSEYRYFTVINGEPELVGVRRTGDERPAWWDDIETLFAGYCGCQP